MLNNNILTIIIMGVKGFSKTFKPTLSTLKKLKGKKAAIDASVMIYQSALGMKNINGLTDTDGNPTLHINVIHSRILNFNINDIEQHWVFDYHEKNYISPDKIPEIKKRNDRKENAQAEIDKLQKKKTREEELFSESDSDEKETDDKINKLKKITFSPTETMFNDCKYLLNVYGIQWSIAPKGIEAEYVCAKLCNISDCDFVYTTDIDALMYKAPVLIRPVKSKGKKLLQKYVLSDILLDNKITHDDLTKIAMILGTDHAPKTPRIGPGTVLKKFKDVELSDEQKSGMCVFSKPFKLTKTNNVDLEKKELYHRINSMLNWLVAKNFNRERVKKQITKVYKDFN